MSYPRDLADRDRWIGFSFELAIRLELNEVSRAVGLVSALARHPQLIGPLTSPYGDPPSPLDAWAAGWSNDSPHVYAILRLALGEVGCLIIAARSEAAVIVSVGIPAGMLERIYPIRYPEGIDENPWMIDLARDLVGIATDVSQLGPFRLVHDWARSFAGARRGPLGSVLADWHPIINQDWWC